MMMTPKSQNKKQYIGKERERTINPCAKNS